jgi:hypothetical protein
MEKGMVKTNSRKERKIVKDVIHIHFLMDKQSLFVPFVEILGMLKTPVEPKKGQWRMPNNSQKAKPRNVRGTSLKKAQYFTTATAKAASASASKNNDYDEDKFDKHDFMNKEISWQRHEKT